MRLPRTPRHARVELLPLMDVVFLLLVFLIYAMLVMAVHRGMPVSLPVAQNIQPDQTEALALTIAKNGGLWLEKQPVSLEALPEAVRRAGQKKAGAPMSEPALQIFADAALPYQQLFTVLDALKKAGFRKISLRAKAEG